MGSVKTVAWWLVIIAAINSGLVGLGVLLGGEGWNVVNGVLGGWPMFEAFVYTLVGLSGVWLLWKKVTSSK